MSHIHIPDGVIPFIWWFGGYVLTAMIIFILTRNYKQEEIKKKIPYTGVAAALMLVTMSVPLGIVPVHLSLAVLTGILVGPGLGFLAVFVVNLLLAFIGHGGFTVVGINTLVIGIELCIGVYIFRRMIRSISASKSTMIANVIGVLASLVLMVVIVGATTGWAETLPHHDHHHHEEEIEEEVYHHHDHFHAALDEVHYLWFTGWTAVILILLAGLILEAIIAAAIVGFVMKVRPDIIEQTHQVKTL